MSLDEKYSNIANWTVDGCIEIGNCDEYTGATARAFDMGGTIWESTENFATLEAALDAIEQGIAGWYAENGIEWEE